MLASDKPLFFGRDISRATVETSGLDFQVLMQLTQDGAALNVLDATYPSVSIFDINNNSITSGVAVQNWSIVYVRIWAKIWDIFRCGLKLYGRPSVTGTANQKFWNPIHPDSGTNTTEYHESPLGVEGFCLNDIQEVRGSTARRGGNFTTGHCPVPQLHF